jgi:hypothetical protein
MAEAIASAASESGSTTRNTPVKRPISSQQQQVMCQLASSPTTPELRYINAGARHTRDGRRWSDPANRWSDPTKRYLTEGQLASLDFSRFSRGDARARAQRGSLFLGSAE